VRSQHMPDRFRRRADQPVINAEQRPSLTAAEDTERRQCARSPRPRLSLGVTPPGRYQPRPRLSTRYRLNRSWGAHRRLAPGLDPGHGRRRAHHAPNPPGSHGRPPSGPPATGGTVLIALVRLAAGDCLMGVQLGFMGVQLGGKAIGAGAAGSSGRLSPRRPEVSAW
jgi:hypothetical protein